MSEHELLTKVANLSMLTFMVSNMLAFGMRLSLAEILEPLRDIKATLKALLANFVIVPAAAYTLLRVFHLEPAYAIGLLLVATSGGDPATTKGSQLAKGNPAYTLAVMVALQIMTVLLMPIILPPLVPGVHVDPFKVAKPLVLFLLAPLAIGLLVHAQWSGVAAKLWKPLDRFSSLAFLVVISLFIGLNFRTAIDTVGSYAMLTSGMLVAVGFFAGYFLGAPGQIRKSDLAIQTSFRGLSAAVAVAITNFPTEPKVLVMVIITLMMSLPVLLGVAPTVLRRKNVAAAQSRDDGSDVTVRCAASRE
jgi:BASS family bile acid:Na+ symporter